MALHNSFCCLLFSLFSSLNPALLLFCNNIIYNRRFFYRRFTTPYFSIYSLLMEQMSSLLSFECFRNGKRRVNINPLCNSVFCPKNHHLGLKIKKKTEICTIIKLCSMIFCPFIPCASLVFILFSSSFSLISF